MPEYAQKTKLYNHVDFLTDLRPYRNYKNLESLEDAAKYIEYHFEQYGLSPRSQSWRAKGNSYDNVIASYNAHKAKKLIVGAHYDVFGDQPGADDNASAVAGLIETARLIAEDQPELDYGIEFVAYCLEEPPFYATRNMGSYVHAQSLSESQADVIGMICYEMIGYFSDEPNSQNFPHTSLEQIYPDTANFIMVVGVKANTAFNQKIYKHMSADAKIDVQIIEFPDKDGLAGMSDQQSYWRFGYNALMINDTSFMRNPHYHEKTDTIDTLVFDKKTAVGDACYQAIVNLGD